MSIRLLVRDVFASPALFSCSDRWFLSPDVCGGGAANEDQCGWVLWDEWFVPLECFWVNYFAVSF